jgi:2-polyprenyl-3-methyl-5-hydroxy-6-metoxy-1,4-benzoquinol methylase
MSPTDNVLETRAHPTSTVERAANTKGVSKTGIYEMVGAALNSIAIKNARILDIACGIGLLHPYLIPFLGEYEGADIVRYSAFPDGFKFHLVDCDTGKVPAEDGAYDVVISVETIEHLENPRAFVRELARLTKPGGWVMITTPNQLSLLSKATLVFKNHFTFFGKDWYPAHLSALLEIDLIRMANDVNLTEVKIQYGHPGRIILTAYHFAQWVARTFPRACNDNVMLVGRKAGN